jgi:hypothetical protein
MYYVESQEHTGSLYVICDCPAGQSKLRYLRMSEKEKRKERRERRVER